MTPIELIKAERERQKSTEGWSEEHDDQHEDNELALAAVCYAAPTKEIKAKLWRPLECNCREAGCPHESPFGETVKEQWVDPWPWSVNWDKRDKHDREKQLVIAGALIVAELERLRRARVPQ